MRRFIEDWLCWGESITMISPSGAVELTVCDGWCRRWTLKVHGAVWEGHGYRSLQRAIAAVPESHRVAGEEIGGLLRSPGLPRVNAMR